MGFDLYGLKPNLTREEPKIDWDKKPSKEERDAYFKDYQKFEEENVGFYFRNNVWWWRPLASYVVGLVGDVLTNEEKERFHDNSGVEINQEKALLIADKLQEQIKNGAVKTHERLWEADRKKAEEHNKKLDEQQKELAKLVEKKVGKSLAPKDYPKAFLDMWQSIQKENIFQANYPFSEENVKDFIKFCRASGGFKIC